MGHDARMVQRPPARRLASPSPDPGRTWTIDLLIRSRLKHTAHTSRAYCRQESSSQHRLLRSAPADLRASFASQRLASVPSYPARAAEPELECCRNTFRSSVELRSF